jgi:hypothetical protein
LRSQSAPPTKVERDPARKANEHDEEEEDQRHGSSVNDDRFDTRDGAWGEDSRRGFSRVALRVARDRIVVIGRQHPPEVAGTVGFMRFIETLAAETDLACDFRARFRVLCVPLVNPDGVHEGNWRSTLGHVDANRDWHDFSQPETRAVRDAIATFASPEDARVRLLLDFHATAKDVFYVPPDEAPLEPPHFARDWLRAIQTRFPDYAVESSATHNVSEWTFKRSRSRPSARRASRTNSGVRRRSRTSAASCRAPRRRRCGCSSRMSGIHRSAAALRRTLVRNPRRRSLVQCAEACYSRGPQLLSRYARSAPPTSPSSLKSP